MLLLRIKYRLALLYKTILFQLGLGNHLLKNRYGERILVFHSLDFDGNTDYNSRFVSKDYFEALIQYFLEHYNLISLDDFYAQKFKKDMLNIAITFDDGLSNNYELALPILEKYKVPATFFITTIPENKKIIWSDFLDLVTYYTPKKEILFNGNYFRKNHKKEFAYQGITLKNYCTKLDYEKIKLLYEVFEEDWNNINSPQLETYWKLMSQEQLQEIAQNPLFTIGAHAMTHANLVAISKEKAQQEIRYSKTILEDIIKNKITAFAFPFGTYTDELVDHCEEIGFSKILLLDYNVEKDSRKSALKNRFVINPYISKNQLLACLLKGSYR
ncbi:polysaccharide deacetylase family protein [Flavobacterium sp.]|uniref:polysaccharide deacetylase family protein n=1 Tax=Flavobacterium sp. TaxID=239 RepID=UPI00286C8539|nr:polysaccharide deacetylase family protein [Flavobacterium sp.]